MDIYSSGGAVQIARRASIEWLRDFVLLVAPGFIAGSSVLAMVFGWERVITAMERPPLIAVPIALCASFCLGICVDLFSELLLGALRVALLPLDGIYWLLCYCLRWLPAMRAHRESLEAGAIGVQDRPGVLRALELQRLRTRVLLNCIGAAVLAWISIDSDRSGWLEHLGAWVSLSPRLAILFGVILLLLLYRQHFLISRLERSERLAGLAAARETDERDSSGAAAIPAHAPTRITIESCDRPHAAPASAASRATSTSPRPPA